MPFSFRRLVIILFLFALDSPGAKRKRGTLVDNDRDQQRPRSVSKKSDRRATTAEPTSFTAYDSQTSPIHDDGTPGTFLSHAAAAVEQETIIGTLLVPAEGRAGKIKANSSRSTLEWAGSAQNLPQTESLPVPIHGAGRCVLVRRIETRCCSNMVVCVPSCLR
jgi:hypothetical protein